jgi:hypothetical protein
MMTEFVTPKEEDSIDCHLQQLGMGTLICRAARLTGDKTTNEVDAVLCYNCHAGKIFRDVGCDAVTPKIWIYKAMPSNAVRFESLFCNIRKRETTLEYCKTCNLVTAETTREIVTSTRGLFEAHDFYSAYKDIEKAREALRDGNFENAVTRSVSCLESVMRTCHDQLGVQLPNRIQVSDLWKSLRSNLKFDDMNSTGSTETLLNSLSGLSTALGGLRNSLSDAHGRGNTAISASAAIAELAINTASTFATVIIRRFNSICEKGNE